MAEFGDAQIVGITGKAGHGKDTFYRSVLAPLGFERIGLADPLKGGLLADTGGNGWRMENTASAVKRAAQRFYEFHGAVKSEATRRELQQIGTDEIREKFDPCIWSVIAMKEIRARVMAGARVAITDVRFPDEAWVVQGQRSKLLDMYLARAIAGKPSDPATRWAATHYWDEWSLEFQCHGALPVAPTGIRVIGHAHIVGTVGGTRTAVVRVSRPVQLLEGAAAQHVSETRGDEITPDVAISAGSIQELALEGRKYFGVPEWERGTVLPAGLLELMGRRQVVTVNEVRAAFGLASLQESRVGLMPLISHALEAQDKAETEGLQRFWMVMAERRASSPASTEPRVRHTTVAAAKAEAGRLAQLHPSTVFYVLEMIGSAVASSVVFTQADRP